MTKAAPPPTATPDPVLDQYDTPESAQFYSIIMGDGTAHVHYGLYTSPADTTCGAAAATSRALRALAEGAGVVFRPGVRVLDLGAGNGGAAHDLAAATGASVTCLNLCGTQNAANGAAVEAAGLSSLVTVVQGSFEDLPDDWTGAFDVVWSQDAFVHAGAKARVFAEAARVLVPGGHVVMSDIMAAPAAAPSALAAFKDRLHVEELLTLDGYEAGLRAEGVTTLRTRDVSGHLVPNYRRMLARITTERGRLGACSDAYLATYAGLLRDNIEVLTQGEAQAWCMLVARKEGYANGASTPAVAATPVAAPATAAASAFPNGAAANGASRGGEAAPPLLRRWVASKLHGVAVTRKSVRYHGSVGVSRSLMAAAGISEFETVDVVNLTNGARWTTYALGMEEDAAFSLNGGGARLGEIGDECVLMTYATSAAYTPARVAICGGGNVVIDTFAYEQRGAGGGDGGQEGATMAAKAP